MFGLYVLCNINDIQCRALVDIVFTISLFRLLGSYWTNSDIFTARNEDCIHTRLVQHNIDTGDAHPSESIPIDCH